MPPNDEAAQSLSRLAIPNCMRVLSSMGPGRRPPQYNLTRKAVDQSHGLPV